MLSGEAELSKAGCFALIGRRFQCSFVHKSKSVYEDDRHGSVAADFRRTASRYAR